MKSKTTLRFSENPQASTRFRCRAAYGRLSRLYRNRARACLVWLRSLAWSGCSSRPEPTVHTHRRPAGGQGSQARGLHTIDFRERGCERGCARKIRGAKRVLTAGHDLLLQLRLASHERPRQRPADPVAVRVLAAAPREERRAIRPVPNLHVREPKLGRRQHLVLHLFLACRGDDTVCSKQRSTVRVAGNSPSPCRLLLHSL